MVPRPCAMTAGSYRDTSIPFRRVLDSARSEPSRTATRQVLLCCQGRNQYQVRTSQTAAKTEDRTLRGTSRPFGICLCRSVEDSPELPFWNPGQARVYVSCDLSMLVQRPDQEYITTIAADSGGAARCGPR
jgi:hypothetical protein